MKATLARLTLVWCIIFVSLIFTGLSSALDPETIAGVWLFDEGSGDVAIDSSPNGNDGEFVGDPRMFIIFDSETMPNWLGMPKDSHLPSTYTSEHGGKRVTLKKKVENICTYLRRPLMLWRLSMLIVGFVMATVTRAGELKSPREGWDFKFKDFVIGAWWGPCDTEAEVRLYKEASFNIAMAGRYMWGDNPAFVQGKPTYNSKAGTMESLKEHLDLLHKHRLGAMIDLYYLKYSTNGPWWNPADTDRPDLYNRYGSDAGLSPGKSTDSSVKWLHEIFGKHPALVGYLLGDDKSKLPSDITAATKFLRDNVPHLFPWVCQNVMNAESLAKAGNPIIDPQIYPTLYQRDQSAEEQVKLFCRQLQRLREDCLKYGLIMWPMFNVCGVVSDSLIRFQIYSSLAYGAEGIWYFHYEGGFIQRDDRFFRGFPTVEEARKHLRSTWYDAKLANNRVLTWGSKLLGRIAAGVYQSEEPNSGEKTPSKGELIEQMDDKLLVGILYKPDEPLLAMVVDKRVSKKRNAYTPREIQLRFADTVTAIHVLKGERRKTHKENIIKLTMPAGGGQLLELEGVDYSSR